jgi:hypothetical protein
MCAWLLGDAKRFQRTNAGPRANAAPRFQSARGLVGFAGISQVARPRWAPQDGAEETKGNADLRSAVVAAVVMSTCSVYQMPCCSAISPSVGPPGSSEK